ncbi:uncharacterized protein LOC127446056 [Myxocyprinus asiaticus]|uniref:uncharacterized protein LOC127446056 n=1 Tax=Myxocyprinus asiaticus TaxID=70543 RepID=UPI002222A315|nr:uncharacterized protein LOC127446056 [Myxocyprinus asiaticus]
MFALPKTNHITAFKNLQPKLQKHIERKHGCQLKKCSELTTAACRKYEAGTSSSNFKQMKLEETKKVSQISVDSAILRFIVQGLQPFSLVEQPSFQRIVLDLQSKCVVMSQITVWCKIDSATITMKEQVKEAMKKAAYIATTTDCWTARRKSFIGITAHWLDPCSFERHSVALAFKQLKGSHKFDVLACAMHDIYAEYEISEKIVRTTTDNGSNFIKAFHVFGPDENNVTAEKVTGEGMTQEDDDGPDDEMEVEFIDVEAIMAEDDGLQYQLPKHHQLAICLI